MFMVILYFVIFDTFVLNIIESINFTNFNPKLIKCYFVQQSIFYVVKRSNCVGIQIYICITSARHTHTTSIHYYVNPYFFRLL